MNKYQLLASLFLLSVALSGFLINSDINDDDQNILAVRRGKVTSKNKPNDLEKVTSSNCTADYCRIEGMVFDDNGKSYELIPKDFPRWFILGRVDSTHSVLYNIVKVQGVEKAKVTKFLRKGRIWKESDFRYWVCALTRRKKPRPRGYKILIKNYKEVDPNTIDNCIKGEIVEFYLDEKGTSAKIVVP